jgi:hypothetical protein
MPTGLVELYNLALSACGSVQSVSDPLERSREADLCRLWFPTARDSVLAAAPWPSVRKYARLALLVERDQSEPWLASDPDPEFRYSYAIPSDMIHPYHLQSFRRFTYGLVGANRVISTDDPAPILFYNSRQEEVENWEPGLRFAAMYTLAFHIARPLTGRGGTQETNATLAQLYVDEAATRAANGQEDPKDVLPDWLQARGYADAAFERWFYPMQSLNLSVSK